MNSKIKELAEKAGFCFWSAEPWKPEGAVIDWASNYDSQFEKFLELLKKECSGIAMSQCLAWSFDGYDELDEYERGKADAASIISGRIHALFDLHEECGKVKSESNIIRTLKINDIVNNIYDLQEGDLVAITKYVWYDPFSCLFVQHKHQGYYARIVKVSKESNTICYEITAAHNCGRIFDMCLASLNSDTDSTIILKYLGSSY